MSKFIKIYLRNKTSPPELSEGELFRIGVHKELFHPNTRYGTEQVHRCGILKLSSYSRSDTGQMLTNQMDGYCSMGARRQ